MDFVEENYIEYHGLLLNRDGIATFIPHRDHALEHLDGVVSFNAEAQSITTVKYADPSWNVFSGHYPAFPAVPAHDQVECGFMTMALLYVLLHPEKANESLPMARKILEFDFMRPISLREIFYIRVSNPLVTNRRILTATVMIYHLVGCGKEQELASGRLVGMRQDGKTIL